MAAGGLSLKETVNIHGQRYTRHRRQAVESLQYIKGRWRYVSPIRHRAHLSAIPEDGEGDRDRGPAPQGLPLGRSRAQVTARTLGILQGHAHPPGRKWLGGCVGSLWKHRLLFQK